MFVIIRLTLVYMLLVGVSETTVITPRKVHNDTRGTQDRRLYHPEIEKELKEELKEAKEKKKSADKLAAMKKKQKKQAQEAAEKLYEAEQKLNQTVEKNAKMEKHDKKQAKAEKADKLFERQHKVVIVEPSVNISEYDEKAVKDAAVIKKEEEQEQEKAKLLAELRHATKESGKKKIEAELQQEQQDQMMAAEEEFKKQTARKEAIEKKTWARDSQSEKDRSRCSSGFFSATPDDCMPCSNGPENAIYVGSSGPENECPWACAAGFFRHNNRHGDALCRSCKGSCNVGEYSFGCGESSAGVCKPCSQGPWLSVYTGDGGHKDNCPWQCHANWPWHSNHCLLALLVNRVSIFGAAVVFACACRLSSGCLPKMSPNQETYRRLQVVYTQEPH
eukprot:gnl/MRDRNA2_/MRDRNA2_34833_c0_seq1.p1 gnl/MRDRNA2_/MRDRNA2_34833_c0~~gnl/MRDRNA2_/MRDRNA2_34833_c0_seq1.p1  ORF type:complete len:390 (+),score=87.83 gnl/MRDRNA2_/MRDRNA2_34833_c0_seq1:87-1256(+)